MALTGKRALITGAGFGNGRAMAVRFAREGADVVVADIDAARAEETAALVRDLGRRAVVTRTNVCRRDECEAAVRACVEAFGGIDIAVANAGISHGVPFLDMTEEDWDRVMDVNLKGVFFTCQAAARQMVAQGTGGRIITIASIMAEIGSAGSLAYNTSKGGVKIMTKCMALALAPYKITVNAIGPGYIETGMTAPLFEAMPELREYVLDRTPLQRIGSPEDVAALAAFIASDEASFMTGTITFTDGGYLAGQYSERQRQLGEEMRRRLLAQTGGSARS